MASNPREYRSNATLTRAVATLLWINVAIAVVAIWSTLKEISLLEAISEGQQISMAEAEASDNRQFRVGMVQIAAYVLTAVAFLVWVYRTNRNTGALGLGELRFTPGWSVGWWFVPVMNLFRPYQIVSELWERNAAAVPASPQPALGLWWGFHLAGALLGNLSLRLGLDAQDADALLTSSWTVLGSDACTIGAGVLAAHLVRTIQRGQEQEAGAPAPAA